MEALQIARDQLAAATTPVAPEAYRIRLSILLGLACILAIQSSLYLCLWVRDAMRRGRTLKLLRLQRFPGGRLITVQPLYAYTVFEMLMSLAMVAALCVRYSDFFLGGSRRNKQALDVLMWTPSSMAGLAYTFANFNATLLAWSRIDSFAAASKIWVTVYNTALVTTCITWLGSVITLGLLTNSAGNAIVDKAMAMLGVLEDYLASPSKIDQAALARLAMLQQDLVEAKLRLKSRYYAWAGLAIGYCVFYAIAAAVSLYFVYSLKEQLAKTRGARRGGSITPVPMSQVRGNSSPAIGGVHAAISPRSNVFTIGSARSQDSGTIVLRRVVRNLYLSVPLVLCLTVYHPIAGGLAVAWMKETAWAHIEFRNDHFIWPEVILQNLLFAWFLINHIVKPGEYGAHHDNEALSRPFYGHTAPGGSNVPQDFPPDGIYAYDACQDDEMKGQSGVEKTLDCQWIHDTNARSAWQGP